MGGARSGANTRGWDAFGGATRRLDHGFFGPGSPTWKVWGYPTSPLIGFQRAVVVEEYDPFLIAAVDALGGIYADPRVRYDHTVMYFAIVAFGDSRTAIHASEHLMQVHAAATGIEPISGKRYAANAPASQLWIHVTAWQSILLAYETYGPGPLSPEEEARYWRECAVAAELQTCNPDDVPRSREEVREYYASVRPGLCISEASKRSVDHLLDAAQILPLPRLLAPVSWTAGQLVRAATIATMPRWMRQLAGVDQPAAVDAAVRPIMRAAMRASEPVPMRLAALSAISPSTRPVVEPVFRRQAPIEDRVVTPSEARERFGRAARATSDTVTPSVPVAAAGA